MRKLWRYMLCAALCMGLLMLFSGAAIAEGTADGLEVHFLDIGRNDGILIRCGEESAFIDSGVYKYGKIAAAYMQGIGMDELTYYIGTHAHRDHVGGGSIIINAFHPKAVIQPHDGVKRMIARNAKTAEEKAAVKSVEYINLQVGQQITLGGATLTCLGPVRIRDVSPETEQENNNSLVLMLTYGETDILLTGDAAAEEYLDLLAVHPQALSADVLKNAHHGARIDEAPLAAIQPEYIVFSTDKSSQPNEKMLNLLNKYGVKMFSTAPEQHGNVILRTDGRNIRFETQHRAETISFKENHIELYASETYRTSVSVSPGGRKVLLTYTSSDPSVASVDGTGRIVGLKAGQAIITATDGTEISAQCTVTVKPPELQFKKSELTVKDGSKVTAGYKIVPSKLKPQITWTSADERIAVVDQSGRITGIYPGETVIRAAVQGGAVSEIKVTVTPIEVKRVSIKPSSVSMLIGSSRTVAAVISPSNATWQDVVWSSADETILTVDQNGLITAVGVGRTKLTATAVNGKSKTINVTVKPVYVKKIIPAESSIELIAGMAGYESAKLSYSIEPADATIQTVAWKSSNPKVAVVSESGVVTGLKTGTATITCKATDGSGRYARIKINVEVPTQRIVLNKTSLEIYEGKTGSIKASIEPYSRTKKVTYTSLNPEIAEVSSAGRVTGIKAGTAVIRASDKMGVYADCVVTVSPATMFLRKSEITVKDGKSASVSYTIKPSGSKPEIEWLSMDESIATVNEKGKITGQYPGETIIAAVMPSGQVCKVNVTVTPVKASRVTIKPSSVTLTIGDSRSVAASVSPSNATWQEITWSVEDESIASITQNGVIRAVGVGETTITATTPEGKTRSAAVRVKPVYVKKISLAQPNIELIGGVSGRNQVQLSYCIEPANATIQDVTWSSSNKKIAVVDANGVVTGLKEGTVTITCRAADGSGRYQKLKVTFKANELNRSVQAVPGEMTVQAERIRYKDSGRILEVKISYKNRTADAQQVPQHGFLTLITPNGEYIVLKQIADRQESLRTGRSNSFTYRIPVSTNPKLAGLDLSRCDAVMLTAQEAFAN